jgi:hypothetical protein
MSKVEIKKHINFTKDPNTKSSNKKIRIKFDKKKNIIGLCCCFFTEQHKSQREMRKRRRKKKPHHLSIVCYNPL